MGQIQTRGSRRMCRSVITMATNGAGENGWTAMHGAAYSGSNENIKVLVEHGGNLNAKDNFGQTPLSIAECVITKGAGDALGVKPTVLLPETAAVLLKLGATPL